MSGSPTPTVTLTPTPGDLKILNALVAPNPAWSDPATFRLRLSAAADRVRIRIFSASDRKLRDTELFSLGGGVFHLVDLGLRDSLGTPLANGSYHFLVEAFDGSRLADAKAGSFFILR